MNYVPSDSLSHFLGLLAKSLGETASFKGMTFSKPRPLPRPNPDLLRLDCRPLALAGQSHISVLFHYERRDETKNYLPADFLSLAGEWLSHQFLFADLRCAEVNHSLRVDRHNIGHLVSRRVAAGPSEPVATAPGHNRVKRRNVDPAAPWLTLLGISDERGQVIPRMQDKFRQIDKFVEIIEDLIADMGDRPQLFGDRPDSGDRPAVFSAVDMGCGKAYLTFALYEALLRWGQTRVCGVEVRPDLVRQSTQNAAKAGFSGLEFALASINDWQASPQPGFERPDILVALHACDTATDDALLAGIWGQTRLIICSPCCHKQVRAAMKSNGPIASITRFGILEERLAEILTDAIRALVLEAHGYKTKVFEFISTEHTGKNVMITAQKLPGEVPASKLQAKLAEAAELMAQYGIARHYLLENLTRQAPGNQA